MASLLTIYKNNEFLYESKSIQDTARFLAKYLSITENKLYNHIERGYVYNIPYYNGKDEFVFVASEDVAANRRKELEESGHKNARRIWLVPANPNTYDVEAAFNHYDSVDWRRFANYENGDILFIYESGNIQKVRYKAKVIEGLLRKSDVFHDDKFWKNEKEYQESKERDYTRIQLINVVDTNELSFPKLRECGLKSNLQGPIKLTGGLLNYIMSFFKPDSLVDRKERDVEMDQAKVEKILLKNKYIDFAYNRYLKFKETPIYDETYKWKVLEELNEYFQKTAITEATVVEVAKKIQESNPTTGSFVHWNNTNSLVEHATQRPKKVAELWNQLYDNSLPLEDRIANFHEEAKESDESLALGAALYGYLLAAYDYTKYPLYKGEIYQEAKLTYEIDQKLGSVSKNYSTYFMICQVMLEYLSGIDSDITMLDIQDFLYCNTRYNKVKVESAADYLAGLSTTLNTYKKDPKLMIEGIIAQDKNVLLELREIYRGNEKINKMKFLILDKMIEEGNATIDDLEKIKVEVSQLYDTNILQSFNNFTILFHLIYHNIKKKIQLELGKIHQAIRQISGLEDFDFTLGKTINGFNWNNSFGGSESWLAVYETKYASHRVAPQFFVRFDKGELWFGLVYGDEHEDRGVEELERTNNVSEFTYEALEKKMNEVAEVIRKINVMPVDPYDSEDVIEKSLWLELFEDNEVVKEENLLMLQKIYELNGEATGTELATAIGKTHSATNLEVVALAKRIYTKTKIEKFIDTDGKIIYWKVLFTGEYIDNGNFRWIMKDNLYNAIEEYINNERLDYPIYAKTDFLKEVFIEESLYDTTTDLLRYKKNIILQGHQVLERHLYLND